MKYCTASVLLEKLKTFQETLKFIDIDRANIKRDGAYTEALTQLELVLDSQLDLEVITHPDNTLRNIMMLAHFDSTDAKTRKLPILKVRMKGNSPVPKARVFIGESGTYTGIQVLNDLTDEKGEIAINPEWLIKPYVLRIRKAEDGLCIKPFEISAEKAKKIWTTRNPYSKIKGVVNVKEDIL